MFAVLRRDPSRPDDLDGHDVPRFVRELDDIIALVENEDVTLRGIYDVSGLRADADVMLWLHGPTAEGLQWALRELRRSRLFRALLPTWNAMGVHRDAEFNKAHVPGFLRGIEPKQWLTVYPFVRSYEWYLLDPAERGRMLAEHGAGPVRRSRASSPTPSRRSRSATTSGCCRSRPTSSPTSSTSCATCAPPTRAATCAKRCRSTRAAASRRPNSSRWCSSGRGEPRRDRSS